MDGPSHYREAESLIVLAERALASNGFGTHVALIAQAQVHATLALAAAQVEIMESTELRPGWVEIVDGGPYRDLNKSQMEDVRIRIERDTHRCGEDPLDGSEY